MGTAYAAATNCTLNGATQNCTATFAYTGAAETWTVPGSVTSVTVDLYGGKGGDGFGGVGGKGAHVHAVLPVTGGEMLSIAVAGQGGEGQAFGGGGGSSSGPGFFTNGGGGASDMERNGVRLLVAGGGGGAGTSGGIGGGDSGNPGVTFSGFGAGVYDAHGGGAGTASAGGAGGAGGVGLASSACGSWTNGVPGGDGGLGQGGDGSAYPGRGGSGGGGGGGYYGGGGGGSAALCNTLSTVGRPGGGGGGSSYIDASATQGSLTEGVQNGNGQVILAYGVTDNTPPSASPTQSPASTSAGWNNTDVTVNWNWSDNVGGFGIDAANCTLSSTSSGQGELRLSATCRDLAGNQGSAEYAVKVDTIKPTISAAATTAANAAGWYNSNVTVHFTCADALSGVANCPANESLSSEGSVVNSTVQTVSDLAGNVSDPSNGVTVQIDKTAPVVAVTGVSNGANYTVGSVPTAACSTNDALSGVATQATFSVSGGNPDGSGAFTATCSGATDLAGNSTAPVSVSYTVQAAGDACLTPGLLDNFNRAKGGLGKNWTGLTEQEYYKLANNRVDVQKGGPVVWKPTSFGPNQTAFVTLSTVDAKSPAQGVLLKVQTSNIPNAGAIAVVYDSVAKAVRVATLRLNNPTWTPYGNVPVAFANGDKLGGCVKANGTVRVYKNNTLLTTITLNAADQSFFNTKGGKLGLWTIAAPNAFLDDFGGGALDGVSAADTADEQSSPNEAAQANLIFLPVVSR